MSKNPYTYQHNFDITNITTDPFALGTLTLGMISWIIFIGGSIAATTENLGFPRFSWWTIAYEIAIIVILFLFYCYDLIDSYRNFLSASFAIAFMNSTNSANYLVYTSGSALAASSTGVILISMLNMIWILYYGGDVDSPINRWIDGFSLNRKRSQHIMQLNRAKSTRISASRSTSGYDSLISHPISNSFSQRSSMNDNPFNSTKNYTDFDNQTQTNTQLNSTVSRSNSQYSHKYNTSTSNFGNGLTTDGSQTNLSSSNFGASTTDFNAAHDNFTDNNSMQNDANNFNQDFQGNQGFHDGQAYQDDQEVYPYRARALYAYEANADDDNEISFEKGEILMISDIQGRWWQAKRENGQVGICPSNYVELM